MDKVKEESPAVKTEAPLAKSGRRFSRWWLALILVILVPAGTFAIYAWGTLSFAYSSGDRVGYLQKLSRKGWICKTWEGELAMATVPGTAPEIFPFSVRDEAVVKSLHALNGQRIDLHYEQHKGVPTACFGETEYFAVGAQAVQGP